MQILITFLLGQSASASDERSRMSRLALVLRLALQVPAGKCITVGTWRVGTYTQLQNGCAAWQKLSTEARESLPSSTRAACANSFGDIECATQTRLLPHARETQRPSIYHSERVRVREKKT